MSIRQSPLPCSNRVDFSEGKSTGRVQRGAPAAIGAIWFSERDARRWSSASPFVNRGASACGAATATPRACTSAEETTERARAPARALTAPSRACAREQQKRRWRRLGVPSRL
eukprot:5128161-Pleurochrysis_carterae.AAC.1